MGGSRTQNVQKQPAPASPCIAKGHCEAARGKRGSSANRARSRWSGAGPTGRDAAARKGGPSCAEPRKGQTWSCSRAKGAPAMQEGGAAAPAGAARTPPLGGAVQAVTRISQRSRQWQQWQHSGSKRYIVSPHTLPLANVRLPRSSTPTFAPQGPRSADSRQGSSPARRALVERRHARCTRLKPPGRPAGRRAGPHRACQ